MPSDRHIFWLLNIGVPMPNQTSISLLLLMPIAQRPETVFVRGAGAYLL